MAHELRVEGDKVIEQDDKGHVLSTKDYTHVHSGYLATTHNPRVSQEAKENAEQLLHDLEAAHGDEPSESPSKAHSPSHSKSSAAPPATDPEGSPIHATRSHDHDQDQEHEDTHAGGGGGGHAGRKNDQRPGESHAEMVHRHRQIGTYKGILKKDVSDESKQHAREMLKDLGAEPSEYE